MAHTSNKLTFVDSTVANTVTVKDFLRGNSAFFDGLVFSITGHKNVQFAKDGKTPAADAPLLKVFQTSTAADTYIWLSSYRADKVKLDISGQPVPKDGTFDQLVLTELNKPENAAKSLDEIAGAIITALNNRQLRVRRTYYNGINARGDKQTMSVVNFDIVG